MALKATIFKARLQIADMDRSVYVDRQITIARHPSENDERMMLRLLALALHVPPDGGDAGTLDFAKGLWDPDEPDLWQKDLTGRIVHWIEVGQPDDKRLLKAAGRAERVTVIAFGSSASIWWAGIAAKIARARNVSVWQIESSASRALAELAQRGMQLQVSVQDGSVWVGDETRSVEIEPKRLSAS